MYTVLYIMGMENIVQNPVMLKDINTIRFEVVNHHAEEISSSVRIELGPRKVSLIRDDKKIGMMFLDKNGFIKNYLEWHRPKEPHYGPLNPRQSTVFEEVNLLTSTNYAHEMPEIDIWKQAPRKSFFFDEYGDEMLSFEGRRISESEGNHHLKKSEILKAFDENIKMIKELAIKINEFNQPVYRELKGKYAGSPVWIAS